ncbi:hypothetical protein K4K61_007469 [Colletotrichum sp. SAR11_59]|nr:hypothetical protein K4K61_007469 [Colletotrichum sp. SAR11_59]
MFGPTKNLDVELQPLRLRGWSHSHLRESTARNTDEDEPLEDFESNVHNLVAGGDVNINSNSTNNNYTTSGYGGYPECHDIMVRNVMIDRVGLDEKQLAAMQRQRRNVIEDIQCGIKTKSTTTESCTAHHENIGSGSEMAWRPRWLQGQVLTAFTGFFLLTVIALAFVFWYSNNHDNVGKLGKALSMFGNLARPLVSVP